VNAHKPQSPETGKKTPQKREEKGTVPFRWKKSIVIFFFFSRILKDEFLFHLSPKFGPFWLKWKRRKSPFWWYFPFRLSFPTSAVKIFSFHWALFDLSCDRRPYFGGIPLISLSFFFWTTCSPPPKKFLTLADGGPQSQIRSQSQIKSPDCLGGYNWIGRGSLVGGGENGTKNLVPLESQT